MDKVGITAQEHKLFCSYIKKICGIHLGDNKDYLVRTRLYKLLDSTESKSFMELYNKAVMDKTGVLERFIINAITTNETSFFRDNTPFEMVKYKIIPDLIDSKNNSDLKKPLNINIWSAACATGQEVYTLAMIFKDLLGDTTKHNVRILGTDISDDAISIASKGFYNDIEMERGVSGLVRDRHFHHISEGWKINDEVRAMANFEKFNLFDSYEQRGPFDIIFCRNVAIYFNEEDKKNIFDRMGNRLKKGGYLIIGATESLGNLCPQFQSFNHVGGVYYQLN